MSYAVSLLLTERDNLVRLRNNALESMSDDQSRASNKRLVAFTEEKLQQIEDIEAAMRSLNAEVPPRAEIVRSSRPLAFGRGSTPESRRRAYFEKRGNPS